jgi:hypothetical protein
METTRRGPAPGTKYKETGSRAEVIRKRTVTRVGFTTEGDLAAALKDFFETQHMSIRMVSERIHLGRDAIRRLVSDYDIKLPDMKTASETGCLDKYGVTNAIKSDEVKQKQKQGMKDWWSGRK